MQIDFPSPRISSSFEYYLISSIIKDASKQIILVKLSVALVSFITQPECACLKSTIETSKKCVKVCSKLTIKTPEQRQ